MQVKFPIENFLGERAGSVMVFHLTNSGLRT